MSHSHQYIVSLHLIYNCLLVTTIIHYQTHHLRLHNTTDIQIARAKEIKSHFLQKQAHEGADARKAAERGATGTIVSLGLVEEDGGGK
jgi:hypothetical protein